MSVLRALIGVGGACVFACLLFRYSIFSLGFPLIAFFTLLLVFGWAIGLAVSGMILRSGLGAEELAWAAIFLVAPVSGVYYPIAVLPAWLQAIAWALPSAHVFEGMRARAAARRVPLGPFLGGGRRSTSSTSRSGAACSRGRSAMRASTARCCRWANSANRSICAHAIVRTGAGATRRWP